MEKIISCEINGVIEEVGYLSDEEYDIGYMRSHGATLEEIANKYNVTRERIRQVLWNCYGVRA